MCHTGRTSLSMTDRDKYNISWGVTGWCAFWRRCECGYAAMCVCVCVFSIMEPQGWVRACCFVTPDCLTHKHTRWHTHQGPHLWQQKQFVNTHAYSELLFLFLNISHKNVEITAWTWCRCARFVQREGFYMRPCSRIFFFFIIWKTQMASSSKLQSFSLLAFWKPAMPVLMTAFCSKNRWSDTWGKDARLLYLTSYKRSLSLVCPLQVKQYVFIQSLYVA